MYTMKIGIMTIIIGLLLGISSNQNQDFKERLTAENDTDQANHTCVNKIDEYDPAVLWNNIRYSKSYHSDTKGLVRDEKIGEVKFKMNGMVCPGYIMKNGDATQAEIGTPIYKVKGYSETFRIFVGDELFEVDDNPYAKVIGDLYDIQGKVSRISIESTADNAPLIDFPADAAQQFIEEYLQLTYVGFREIYNNNKLSGDNYFLRIWLHDHSSFLITYWADANVLTPGAYANEAIKKIMRGQIERLKNT
ncbi:hypothetical protein G3578_07230 [Brevibacillus sp. SYP-B805]|uniref:hypothetical protein n=1 Tax=Brevibacillus sp. SYP-B805 TaxID=1578199 RepID=UPI0013EAB148|nr:hypothetical protein [Brevibacillus sp. SYP-B805]NGQ94977.1 hypothetical protein [Brevibacillus sp. SYP-B805]